MTQRVQLHGGKADGFILPVPLMAQGIMVEGTYYYPPDDPSPYYPDWFCEGWEGGWMSWDDEETDAPYIHIFGESEKRNFAIELPYKTNEEREECIAFARLVVDALNEKKT